MRRPQVPPSGRAAVQYTYVDQRCQWLGVSRLGKGSDLPQRVSLDDRRRNPARVLPDPVTLVLTALG